MKGIFCSAITVALACVAGYHPAHCAEADIDGEIRVMTGVEESTSVTVRGKGELHLTDSGNPLPSTSSINLVGQDAMVCFEGMLPSEAKAGTLSRVTINGEPFDAEKHRLVLYGSGCAVMADGFSDPLTIFDRPDFEGDSKVCVENVYYRSDNYIGRLKWLTEEGLGKFDNQIRSFRLRRGWQATFANNPNGSGYSRVFIASDGDLEVAEMPQGLEFASFIRVSRFDPVGKKGVCKGAHTTLARATWYYDWGAGSETLEDGEYVPMRHNAWWDSWDNINTRTASSCVLGFNEPDHADQSNLGVDNTIEMWPSLMRSGLRVGSPAPDQVTKDWLRRFIATADSLNYRVDFVATHMYWENRTPEGLVKTIEESCRNLFGGRPMWITEWNNGANWTHENWPDREGTMLDANFRPVLDKDGNEQRTTRPHTPANSEKQCLWLASMLEAFDECPWLERHSLYTWVEDARSIVLANSDGVEELTPAGRIFAAFQSRPAFGREHEYVHHWRIAPPFPELKLSVGRPVLRFDDHNGETGVNYIIERRIDRGQWKQVGLLEAGKDYKFGNRMEFKDKVEGAGKYSYRVKATSYIGTESIYSRVLSVDVESAAVDAIIAGGDNAGASVVDGVLILSNYPAGKCRIYSVDGRVARAVEVDASGRAEVSGLRHGVYIIEGGRKVVI